MQNILDKIHTQASIIICDEIEDVKNNLIKEIKEIANSDIKVFEKIADKDIIKFIRGEGQSGLLKVLEELNKNTFVIILTDTVNTILPTVLSRCVSIKIKSGLSVSAIKNTLLKNKDFGSLSRLLALENAAERGSISRKYVEDFTKVVL